MFGLVKCFSFFFIFFKCFLISLKDKNVSNEGVNFIENQFVFLNLKRNVKIRILSVAYYKLLLFVLSSLSILQSMLVGYIVESTFKYVTNRVKECLFSFFENFNFIYVLFRFLFCDKNMKDDEAFEF